MIRLVTVGALVVSLLAGSLDHAVAVGGKAWAPSSFSASKWSSTFRTHYDSYTVQAVFSFNASARAALQALVQDEGWRYTQEMNDYPTDNLNTFAHGSNGLDWSTNLPNPVHDVDDDNTDWRWEEAEVTADSISFPTANYGYIYNQEFSRWWTAYPPYWSWDSGSGTIAHLSQMSYWAIEWQAADWTSIYWNTSYPSKAPPATAPMTSGVVPSVSVDSTPSPGVVGARVALPEGSIDLLVDTTGDETDIFVRRAPDLTLAAYIRQSGDMAARVGTEQSPIEVWITFAKPQTELDSTNALLPGVSVIEFEAIGTDGTHTWTFGGSGSSCADVPARAAAQGVASLGVVAARAWVADLETYRALASQDSVLLVDPMPSVVRQLAATNSDLRAVVDNEPIDVVMNDVYWEYAGLTQ